MIKRANKLINNEIKRYYTEIKLKTNIKKNEVQDVYKILDSIMQLEYFVSIFHNKINPKLRITNLLV